MINVRRRRITDTGRRSHQLGRGSGDGSRQSFIWAHRSLSQACGTAR
jgi:hypothetical protein